MNVSIETQGGIKVLNPYPIDSKYFNLDGNPYNSPSEVFSQLPIEIRHVGLTVNIYGVEYWFANGVTNEDLIEKRHDRYYRYEQVNPETVWIINHNLSKRPSVTITDTAGTVFEADVTYKSDSQIMIEFETPFAGFAELN